MSKKQAANKAMQEWMKLDFTDPKVQEEIWTPKGAVRDNPKMMILGDDMEYRDAPDPFQKLPVLWYYAINKHENKFYQRMRATAPPRHRCGPLTAAKSNFPLASLSQITI